MEEDIKASLNPLNKIAEERLDKAIEEATQILNYEAAHDIQLIQALEIVKKFICKNKFVCYGGTAMNALLPKKDKFYDPEYDLPDYDFFTPDASSAIKELVKDLKSAGFRNIYEKMGIHEGTHKVLVNYVAIADITQIHKDNYKIIFDNSKKVDNIYYANENILRMMMCLELSRPRGEVERWKKVYQRLELINKYFPIPVCKKKHLKKEIKNEIREIIYDYAINNERVIANIELEAIYKKSLTSKSVVFKTVTGGNIVFFSPDLKKDTEDIKRILPNVKVVYHPEKGDFLSRRVSLVYEGKPLVLLVEQTACHSYNNIKTEKGHIAHIASLETLITLHYSLYFFSKSEKTYLCDISKCIKTFIELSTSTISQFDAFPVLCSGYQKGYPTLLREKLARKQVRSMKQIKKKNSTLKKNG